MKSDWIIPALVCAVFPVLIPVALMLVAAASVSAAMKTTQSDELGADS